MGPRGTTQPPFEGGATFALPVVHYAPLQTVNWSQGSGFIDVILIQGIKLPATSLGLSACFISEPRRAGLCRGVAPGPIPLLHSSISEPLEKRPGGLKRACSVLGEQAHSCFSSAPCVCSPRQALLLA